MMGDGHEKRLQAAEKRLDEKADALKELLLSIVNGNDKRYEQRFQAQESANKYSQEKANEFRGSLDDVGKKQMPRTEAEAELKAIRGTVTELKARIDRTEGRSTVADPLVVQQAAEIVRLTGAQQEGRGERAGRLSQQQFITWVLGIIIALIAIAAYLKR